MEFMKPERKIKIDIMTQKQLIGSIGWHIRCCNDCDMGSFEYPCPISCVGELKYKKRLLKEQQQNKESELME